MFQYGAGGHNNYLTHDCAAATPAARQAPTNINGAASGAIAAITPSDKNVPVPAKAAAPPLHL